MGPGSVTRDEKSCSPVDPSEKRMRSLKPPSRSSPITSIIVQTRNTFERQAGARRHRGSPGIEALFQITLRPFITEWIALAHPAGATARGRSRPSFVAAVYATLRRYATGSRPPPRSRFGLLDEADLLAELADAAGAAGRADAALGLVLGAGRALSIGLETCSESLRRKVEQNARPCCRGVRRT